MAWELIEVPGNLNPSLKDSSGIPSIASKVIFFLLSWFYFINCRFFALPVDVVAAKIDPKLANTLIR
jgi:hypothetical protein